MSLAIEIIGGLIALLNLLIIFLLSLIRDDIRQLWERVNYHHHDIDCEHSECKVKTRGVIL